MIVSIEDKVKILLEYADMLKDEDPEAIHEVSDEVVSLIAPLVLIAGAIFYSKFANRKAEKKAAKEATQITLEELNQAIKYVNGLEEDIKKIMNQKKYKELIDAKVITFNNKVVVPHDPTNKKSIVVKGKAFTQYIPLYAVNLYKLAKETGNLDKLQISNDRLETYIKEKTESLAKICDEINDKLLNKNSFIKDNFTITMTPNENKSVFHAYLVSKTMVLNTSKYIK